MPVSSTSPAAPRLRLLQITHDLDLGGLQQVIYNLCRTLDRDRFEIFVLCLRSKGLFASDVEALGIPVYLLEKKQRGADYFAFRKVAKLLRELRIDVVHTHNTQPFFDGTIGAMLAGVRTVVHTDHARAFPDKLRYMVAEWAMSLYAYRVVGCSEHTSQQLMRYEKIPKRKIVTIPNGIDGSRFDLTIDRQAKRRELGIHEQGSVIGLAVRLSDQKGITFLLQAMPRILAKHPDTTLLIAGDGDLRKDLEQEAQQLGIAARVKFCGPRKDIPELLKLLDLYVLPSKWEGLPMVILEAMAAGCPIVATDVGGNSSAVVDGVTGALVPPQNPGALADAIIRLLDSPDLLQTYATNGKNRFRERFSAETMAREYERLYLRRS
ncbi:glycosyl transferase family 1 [Steroidobacter agaridevorans]|uniref:Glycosyl transferase family 1 n=1 Tax=Steroidobacter agaridevorans TaxID=2695856 RepID=A0A829YFV1_9GAMM|nr:glycosyl transferase family 1 [Steroidobacter agaridevorans]